MNDFSKIKGVIFDFDGTLVDTMKGFSIIAGEVIAKWYGISSSIAKKLYIETSGIPFFEQLEVLFPADNNKKNYLASKEFEKRKIKGFFNENFSNSTKETIIHLKKKGIITAISSNNFESLVKHFISMKDGVLFDFVLGYRKNFSKGSSHFNYFMNKTKLKNNEILFVGDSFKDAEKAFSCGINFIGKIGTFKREEFEKKFPEITLIENLVELKELLKC